MIFGGGAEFEKAKERADKLANAILEMANGKKDDFTGGREYTLENASKEICTAKYVETIKSVLGK